MRNKYARVPDPAEFKSPEGDLFQIVYSSYYKPDGSIGLKEADRIDIKKEINSHREETDMSFILSRLMAGDDSVLNPRPPLFGDFTQFPTSYTEMLNMVIDGERYFDSLSPDIRKKFDNDRAKWFAQMGSDFWMESMGFVQDVSSEIVSPDPVDSVSPDGVLETEVIE